MIQRSQLERAKYEEGDEHFRIDIAPRNGYNKIIRRGDIISCDTGINYFGLGTDTQQNAYVLKVGETEVPAGLQKAFNNTNKLQIAIANEFEIGRPAGEVVNASLRTAKAAGLDAKIYGHPLPYNLLRYGLNGGFHKIRYAAGPELGGEAIGRVQEFSEEGGYPIYANTTYAMEIDTMTNVPEWGNQNVRIVMEENVAMTDEGFVFLGGRQTDWYIIE